MDSENDSKTIGIRHVRTRIRVDGVLIFTTIIHVSELILHTHPSGQDEQLAAAPNENSVGEASPQRFSVPSPGQKNPVVHPRHLGLVVEFRAVDMKENIH